MTYLLDASALLALINNEPGANSVGDYLDNAFVHSIHLSEVYKKLIERGVPWKVAQRLLEELGIPVDEQFSADDALETARLFPLTKSFGLSLADRACLALASLRGATAVTADRSWAEISDLDAQVLVIR